MPLKRIKRQIELKVIHSNVTFFSMSTQAEIYLHFNHDLVIQRRAVHKSVCALCLFHDCDPSHTSTLQRMKWNYVSFVSYSIMQYGSIKLQDLSLNESLVTGKFRFTMNRVGLNVAFSINKTIITVSSEQTNQITRKKLEKRRKLNISSERESWALTQCSCLHESFLLLKCVVLHLFCVCVSLAASEMSYERCQTERHVTC